MRLDELFGESGSRNIWVICTGVRFLPVHAEGRQRRKKKNRRMIFLLIIRTLTGEYSLLWKTVPRYQNQERRSGSAFSVAFLLSLLIPYPIAEYIFL